MFAVTEDVNRPSRKSASMDVPDKSLNQGLTVFLESILHPVREHLLVLDSRLHVKSAGKSFYTAFHVTPGETLGKELTNLGNGQWNIPALLARLNELPIVESEF